MPFKSTLLACVPAVTPLSFSVASVLASGSQVTVSSPQARSSTAAESDLPPAAFKPALTACFAVAGDRRAQPLALEPRAQRDVLGVAQLRAGHLLALEVGGGVDAVLDHQLGAGGGGAGDDPDGVAAALPVGGDGRARADVGGV